MTESPGYQQPPLCGNWEGAHKNCSPNVAEASLGSTSRNVEAIVNIKRHIIINISHGVYQNTI